MAGQHRTSTSCAAGTSRRRPGSPLRPPPLSSCPSTRNPFSTGPRTPRPSQVRAEHALASYRHRMIRTRLYRNGSCTSEDFDPQAISDHLSEPDTVVWMDVCMPTEQEFAVLAEEFSLNPLAVEDALHERQRPKLDHYDDHVFISLYAVHLTPAPGALVPAGLAFFAPPRYPPPVRKAPNLP